MNYYEKKVNESLKNVDPELSKELNSIIDDLTLAEIRSYIIVHSMLISNFNLKEGIDHLKLFKSGYKLAHKRISTEKKGKKPQK